MKNEIKITNSNNGVDITIKGDIKFSDVEKLTDNCSSGSCDCSPEMLEKINSINTSGKDGDVNITLKSDTIDESEVQNCMSTCDCGF